MENGNKGNASKCDHSDRKYQVRVPRGFFMRTLFFWLPVKRYLCGNCLKHYYLYVPKQQQQHHHSHTIHAHG